MADSRPQKYTTIIRDPIHGYIHLTDLEEEIVNTPIFLRLQNVKQNPTAYRTYPAHQVDRFVHSLGTLELVNKIVLSAFANTPQTLVQEFLKVIAPELHVAIPEAMSSFISLARLAALLHDIGHLPFSHAGETALKNVSRALYSGDDDHKTFIVGSPTAELPSLHEFVTFKIIKENAELGRVLIKYNAAYQEWLLHVFSPAPTGVYKTVHDIISGEIDADRADYLVRDGKTSGLGFGEYDLMRLTDSMVIHKQDNHYDILPTTAALSSAEAFLVERYKIYKWLCYHQYVVLTETALHHVIRDFLALSVEKTGPLAGFLPARVFHYGSYIDDELPCDDIFMWNRLRDAFRIVRDFNTQPDNKDKRYFILEALLRILLFRQKYAKAVFKNHADYKRFDVMVREYFFKKEVPHRKSLPKDMPLLNCYAQAMAGTHFLPHEKRFGAAWQSDESVLLETERSTFRPFSYTLGESEDSIAGQRLLTTEYIGKFCLVHKHTGERMPITQLSHTVKYMFHAWRNDMWYFPYVVCYARPTDSEWVGIIDNVKNFMIEHLAELWKGDLLRRNDV